jgi:hypothetical protein
MNTQQGCVKNCAPTALEFLLDETGSMASHLDPTINGYNDFLDEQRRVESLCLMTLTKFDSSGLKTPYTDIEVNMVPNLSRSTFIPGDMTNLYDAIIARLNDLRSRLTKWNESPNVLFVVMTDGENNASRATESQVRKSIKEVSSLGWTCVYLGADQNAVVIGQKLGFSAGNIRSFETTKMRETMQELSRATTVFRAGATSASGFFADNATR